MYNDVLIQWAAELLIFNLKFVHSLTGNLKVNSKSVRLRILLPFLVKTSPNGSTKRKLTVVVTSISTRWYKVNAIAVAHHALIRYDKCRHALLIFIRWKALRWIFRNIVWNKRWWLQCSKKICKNFGIVGRSVGIVQYADLGNVHEKED